MECKNCNGKGKVISNQQAMWQPHKGDFFNPPNCHVCHGTGFEMNQYEESIKYLIDAILGAQSRLDTPLEIEVDLRRMSAAEISDLKKYFVDSYNA